MPEHEDRFLVVAQHLEDDFVLGAALFFPEVSRLSPDEEQLIRDLKPWITWCSKQVPPVEVSSRRPATNSDTGDFILPDITVAIGATVQWTNRDSEEHTATPGADGIYDGSGWDSNTLGLKQSFSHQFQQEGVFAYTCRFHPWMNATVTVVADQSGEAPSGGDYYSY